MIKETTTKNCKTCLNWSKNSWKFRFVASELVVGSGEQDPNNIKIRPRRSGSTVPPAGARYSAMGGGGMHSPQQTPSLLMPSPTPTSAQQLLSQQVNKYLVQLIEHPILRIPNFNFPNLSVFFFLI